MKVGASYQLNKVSIGPVLKSSCLLAKWPIPKQNFCLHCNYSEIEKLLDNFENSLSVSKSTQKYYSFFFLQILQKNKRLASKTDSVTSNKTYLNIIKIFNKLFNKWTTLKSCKQEEKERRRDVHPLLGENQTWVLQNVKHYTVQHPLV